MSSSLSFRTKQEDFPLQASKWLQLPALLDIGELRDLLTSLPGTRFFKASGVLQKGEEEVLLEEWLHSYEAAITALKEGKVPDEKLFKKIPILFLTYSLDALYLLKVGEERHLMRALWPVIEMKWHKLSFSQEDLQFRSQLFGPDTFFWGVQFSYPQLIVNPITKEPERVDEQPHFKNTATFKLIQKWMRNNTRPTPFLIGEKKINSPARIGQACLTWVNRNPQLIEKGILIQP